MLLRDGYLVGPDVEAAVNRSRITGDDFSVEPPGKRNGKRALSGRRRADDGDELRTCQGQMRRAIA